MSDIKQNWEVVEHSWSDTSIMCGDKTICTMSIYDEATEETQEELEIGAAKNSKLISAAPDLLTALQELVHLHMCEQEGMSSGHPTAKQWLKAVDKASESISKALGEEVQ